MNGAGSLAPAKAVWQSALPGEREAFRHDIGVLAQQGPRPSPQKPSIRGHHEVLHVGTRQVGKSHVCSQDGLDWQS